MIQVIFFDFDGVLVESIDIKTKAFAKLFEHEGEIVVKKVVEYHLNNTGVSRYEKFNYIYREILHRELDDDTFQILCNKFANLVVDAVVKAPYVKGAEEFLMNYASKYKCFVVSATPQKEMEEIIQRRYMSHFFQAIYGSPKKKSEVVRDILRKENVKPCNTAYIGDALSDFNAARDNSVHFIARINNNEIIFDSIPCTKMRDLSHLNTIIKQYDNYSTT